ncbi:MAG: chromosomal replication initiator protein DnaA, partial [Phycisphaerae bacterium]|nr:chromosomal replication initiator protein DnaA [Phycisphaerae bacterium]
DDISETIAEVTGEQKKITFNIDPELGGGKRKIAFDKPEKATGKIETQKARNTETKRHKRLKLGFETFVVGQSNELAYNAAKAVAREKQSPFNPLFIHGGYGVGKTHLMQGICNEVCFNRPETNWLYLSAEDFANQFVLALKTKKLEAFRRRMRETDLLAIDDIHFMAGKPATQEEFLHTFNSIDLAGKQVVLVSDAHPKMIGQLCDKLVNRFVSGMVVKIDTPDIATRKGICMQFVRSMGRNISESVINFVSENIRTNVREIEGALLKIIAFGSLQNEKITLNMAQSVLIDHLARTDPIVHISDIESAVATYFGITGADLHSSKKDRTIATARHFGMYLSRKLTKMSFPEIGRFMGNKNHATVIMACRKVEEQLKANSQINYTGPAGNKSIKARTLFANLEDCIAQ